METPIIEGQVAPETPSTVTAPAESPQATAPIAETPAPQESFSAGIFDWKAIAVMGLFCAYAIYNIVSARKEMEGLASSPTVADLDNIKAKVSEIESNVRKQMGSKYVPA